MELLWWVGFVAACRSRRYAADPNRLAIKRCAPIASVAALTAQPLAALRPYGCGVPLAGSDRLAGWQYLRYVFYGVRPPSLSFRGAKRRGNLAGPGWITGKFRQNRDCLPEIATAPSGPRNDKSGGLAPLNLCRNHCQPAWRSLSAATFFSRAAALYNERRCRRNRCIPF